MHHGMARLGWRVQRASIRSFQGRGLIPRVRLPGVAMFQGIEPQVVRPASTLGVYAMNASLELVLTANQFRALQPITLWLLVRSITGDEWMLSDEGEGGAMRFKTFLTQNKLQERFGIIGEIQVEIPEQGGTNPKLKVLQYAVLGIPDVYALPLSSAQRQSIWGNFTRWKERVWKTLPILREHGFIAAGSKAIIPFLNLIGSEVKADRKDDFAQWCDDRPGFELDKNKGLVIEFSNVCDDAADLLEKLALRVAESSAVDARETHVLGDEQATNAAHIDAAEINADVVYLDSQDEASGIIDNRRALSPDDQDILLAMLELNADELTPKTQAVILTAALSKNASARKRKFDNLKAWDYVRSAKAIGMYLSAEGKEKAKEILTRT